MNVCKTQAMEGDFGELHAAVRIFCEDFARIWIWGQTLIIVISLTTQKRLYKFYYMARQLRIEFEGAYYHILSRGNNQRSGGRSLVYKFLFF